MDFIITVEPGPLFHMGTLTIQGFPEEARKKAVEGWKLKAGDVYDPGYVSVFLGEGAIDRSVVTHLKWTTDFAPGNLVNVTLRYE